MRRIRFWFLSLAIALCAATPLFAQQGESTGLRWYSAVRPWTRGSAEEAMRQASAAATIPLWTYTIDSSRDGNTYTGTIVGRSPFFHGARTTNVKVFLVPLKIIMPDGHTFDPGAADTCLPLGKTALSLTQGSPIFQVAPGDWTMNGVDVGSGQYIDAFQRAEFFSKVSATGDRYHLALSPVTTLAVQTFSVPAGEGKTYDTTTFGGCGKIGVVDLETLDGFLRGTLIPALASKGVGPTNFPFFLMYNVVMGDPGTDIFSNCCVIGFHGATGFPLQTYSPTDFDSTGIFSHLHDASVMAHEVGEWANDPIGLNPTPAWGHIGQQPGCQDNFEVGDPLSGTLVPTVTMPDGFTYNLQELAYFSWFYGSPSIGAGGDFSNNKTFLTDAGPPCT